MSALGRRQFLAYLSVSSSAILTSVVASRRVSAQPLREIEIVARRFSFTPNEMVLKVNERVVLSIRSLDFVHGLNIPELGIRADLVPGRVTRVELQPRKVGNLAFLCDNFCGDGHEDMHGRIVVSG